VDRLLTPQEVAHALGIKTNTLKKWRSDRKGIPFFRIGKSIRYQMKDVIEWIEKHKSE